MKGKKRHSEKKYNGKALSARSAILFPAALWTILFCGFHKAQIALCKWVGDNYRRWTADVPGKIINSFIARLTRASIRTDFVGHDTKDVNVIRDALRCIIIGRDDIKYPLRRNAEIVLRYKILSKCAWDRKYRIIIYLQ